jgi:hypothetical protein
MDYRLLMRIALLARNPPRGWRAVAVLAVLGIVLLFGVIDWLWGWPVWLAPQRIRP